MIQETKDSIANVTTLVGAGTMYIGFNDILSIVLVGTGIVLNVLRILEVKRKRDSEDITK